jgi:hypothetical protein
MGWQYFLLAVLAFVVVLALVRMLYRMLYPSKLARNLACRSAQVAQAWAVYNKINKEHAQAWGEVTLGNLDRLQPELDRLKTKLDAAKNDVWVISGKNAQSGPFREQESPA